MTNLTRREQFAMAFLQRLTISPTVDRVELATILIEMADVFIAELDKSEKKCEHSNIKTQILPDPHLVINGPDSYSKYDYCMDCHNLMVCDNLNNFPAFDLNKHTVACTHPTIAKFKCPDCGEVV